MIGCELRLRVLLTSVVLCAGVGMARAQAPTNAAAATVQFDRGRALLKEGKYSEACGAFEQSQKLEPASGTLYNLANCYVRLGKLASAWVAYRELAQRDAKLSRRAESAKQAKQLELRLPKLAITTAARPPGLVVTMNGQDITSLLVVENPVDLGTYKIVAKAPGFKDRETSVEIDTEGKTVVVVLELEPATIHEPVLSTPPPPPETLPATTVAREPVKRTDDSDASPPASNRRTYGAIMGGSGVALIATGLVFGNMARGKWNDVKKLCGADLTCDAGQGAEGDRLSDAAHLDGNIATGLVIGGVVAVGVGAYLWLTAPPRANNTALRIIPFGGAASFGLTLQGGF